MQRIKRKKSKCIIRESQQTKTEREGSEKISRNNHKTSDKMAINTYQ